MNIVQGDHDHLLLCQGGVKIVELRGGQRLVEVGPASAPVRVVRFSPDGKLIVTGHDTGTVQVTLSSLLYSAHLCHPLLCSTFPLCM